MTEEEEEQEYWTDVCEGDLSKLLYEFSIPLRTKDIPRDKWTETYGKLCEAYRIITSVIDEFLPKKE